ncbi:MAG: hypothetical protein GY754_08820 [bacterium]|nr:hypothetical protein [bacterium]
MKIKKYALLVLLTGIATFLIMIFITIKSGGEIIRPAEFPNSQGFTQAIFFFEFINSPAEVKQVLGDPATEAGKRLRLGMDTTNRYDFIFLFLYPLLYIVLFLFLHKKIIHDGNGTDYNRYLLILGIIFAFIIIFGDIYENTLLLDISSRNNLDTIGTPLISRLQIAVRIKSIAINGATLLLAYFYLRYFGKSWKLLLPIVYSISTILSIIAISVSSLRYLVETAAAIGMLCWLISTIHGGYWVFKTGKNPSAG